MSVGSNIMENPAFGQEKPVLFFCGDDAGAKGTVKQLAGELGFEGVDAGPLTQARLLEPFALLWISLAFKAGWAASSLSNFCGADQSRWPTQKPARSPTPIRHLF